MKIWKVGLLVEDLKIAEDFYTEVLGMEVIARGPRSVHLDAGPVRLELIHKDVFKDDQKLGNLGVHHLSFKVDDMQQEVRRLQGNGVNIIKEPFSRTEGVHLAFFDGLNNVNLQLYEDKR